jgi:hypothetical protein
VTIPPSVAEIGARILVLLWCCVPVGLLGLEVDRDSGYGDGDRQWAFGDVRGGSKILIRDDQGEMISRISDQEL